MIQVSDLYNILLSAVTIIAVLNPFGNLPQFIAMTEGLDAQTRKALFRNIIYTAFIIVLAFLFSGQAIMTYLFNIDINDLRIAGGIVLAVMSLQNLLFPSATKDFSRYKELDASELLSQSIVPMAFPMLVGPGTLATIVVIAEEHNLFFALLAVLWAFSFILVLFHFAATIEKVAGKLILHVLSRIALVFIMAMGIKMVVIGIKTIA